MCKLRWRYKKNFKMDFPTKAERETGDLLRGYDTIFTIVTSKIVNSKRVYSRMRVVWTSRRISVYSKRMYW